MWWPFSGRAGRATRRCALGNSCGSCGSGSPSASIRAASNGRWHGRKKNADEPRALADELVRRYEAVRPPAGDETADDGLGRALLMHQGVAAWIEVWAKCRAPSREAVSDGAGGPASATDVVPVGLRGHVAQVLTGMAVAGLRGRSSGG